MKSKGIAYLLWLLFGWAGFHRFYVGKVFTGIIYLFTLGLFGLGWFVDLFLLGGYVDTYNALHLAKLSIKGKNPNVNNVVVNVTNSSVGSQNNDEVTNTPEKQQ